MTRAKTKPAKPLPEIPPDDSSLPALMTPRRLAGELERLAVEISRAGLRLRRSGHYLDARKVDGLALDLQAIAGEVEDLSGEVLVGKLAIVAGRDDAAGLDRYPLLEPRGPKPVIAVERDFEHLVEVDPPPKRSKRGKRGAVASPVFRIDKFRGGDAS